MEEIKEEANEAQDKIQIEPSLQEQKEKPKKKAPAGKESSQQEQSQKQSKQPKAKKGKKNAEDGGEAKKPQKKAKKSQSVDSQDSKDSQKPKEGNKNKSKKDPKGAKAKGKAEKKPKKAEGGNGELTEAVKKKIHDYFKKQNRPFSAKNVVDNNKKIISEGKMKKYLEELSNEKDTYLSAKKVPPSLIFWYDQHRLESISKEELDQMQADLDQKRKVSNQLQDEFQAIHKEEQNLKSQLTDEQLERQIKIQEEKLKFIQDEMEFYQSDQYHPVEQSLMDQAVKENEDLTNAYRLRKGICEDFLSQMEEGMQCERQKVLKVIKIDTDEPTQQF